jgi:hypothetical protein
MSYLKLNIDRQNILNLLKGFCGPSINNPTLSSKIVRNGNEEQFTINGAHEGKEKEIKISFISNQDGSTSINYKMGKFQNISQQIADFVVANGVLDNRNNSISSLNAVLKEDFDFVLENLKIDYQSLIIEEKEIPHGIQKKIKIVSGEQVIFNYYETNTLLITGRPLLLHSSTLNYFTDLNYLKPVEIFDSAVQYYQINITFDVYEKELKNKLPAAYEHLPDNIKALIVSGLILEKIEIDLPDYSGYVFYILKAIEGIMKHLLFEKGINIDRTFNIFKDNIEPSKLKNATSIKINCGKTALVIENLYDFYKKERHTLFHTEFLDVSTRILEKREFAIDILNKSLNLINNSYHNLFNK